MMMPFLAVMVPLIYVFAGVGVFVWAARHLLNYSHQLRLKEIKEKARLVRIEKESFREADQLLRNRMGMSYSREEEEELLKAAEEMEDGGTSPLTSESKTTS
jgi:TnpA family transposase